MGSRNTPTLEERLASIEASAERLRDLADLGYAAGYRAGLAEGRAQAAYWKTRWRGTLSARCFFLRARVRDWWRDWWHDWWRPVRRCPRCRVGPMRRIVDFDALKCMFCGRVVTWQEELEARW